MSINRVLTNIDRELLDSCRVGISVAWPELYSRKITDSLVQFTFCYDTVITESRNKNNFTILCAGSYEDIVGETLKYVGLPVLGVDPVLNCDLHTFALRYPAKFSCIVSASVLEHVENDEEFVTDCCKLLKDGGLGIFTMDFKDDWRPGQPVPYTSRRFYTTEDLTVRLRAILWANGCDLVDEPDYSARDRFIYDGINYSFASFVFRKET